MKKQDGISVHRITPYQDVDIKISTIGQCQSIIENVQEKMKQKIRDRLEHHGTNDT